MEARFQQSKRLIYEPLTEVHASVLSEALTDPRTYAHIAPPHPTTTADLAVQLAQMAAGPSEDRMSEIWWNFAVRLREGEFIGRIEATFHDGLAEVAYVFGPLHWGRGYATESLLWLHDQIRQARHADSILATVRPENTRSIRLLERLTYKQVSLGGTRLLSYEPGDRVYHKQFPA